MDPQLSPPPLASCSWNISGKTEDGLAGKEKLGEIRLGVILSEVAVTNTRMTDPDLTNIIKHLIFDDIVYFDYLVNVEKYHKIVVSSQDANFLTFISLDSHTDALVLLLLFVPL